MRKRGISLIILIITIVVMIILATAIMVNIAQTNVIKNANIAVFKADVSAMKDELEMYISDKYTETVGEYEPEKLQATEEGIWYGSNQEEGNIKNILKSMNDKYLGKLFIQDGKLVANKLNITLEEEKLLDDIGVKPAYKTEIGKIEITPSTIEWINGDVTLSISYTKEMPQGYVLEYKINDGKFQEGTQVLVEENNTKVTARLYSKEKDNEALVNSYEVSNIDKENPSNPTGVDITVTENTVTATASGSTDGLSGFNKYEYSLDNNSWQDSGTFSELTYGSSYTVYARAVDKVGNVSESVSNSITIDKLIGNITLSEISGTVIYPTAGTFTVTNNTSGGALSVSSSNTAVAIASISETTVTVTPGTTEGTATITVTSAETSSYTVASATYTATVKNGTLSVTASGYSGIYDGSAYGISVSCSGATIKYGTASGSYTLTSSPTYTDVGTYTVYYQVSKSGYTTETGSKQVVISKASGRVTLSATSGSINLSGSTTFTVTNNTSGGTLSVSSSNTSVATVSISGTTVTVTGKTTAGKSTITVTSAATTNYNATSATYTISVTNPLLSSVVAKGDYVNYPVSYTNISAFCGKSSTLTGWRVLYVSSGYVYLVSAGDPIVWRKDYCSATTASGLVSWGSNTSNFTKFVNSTYGISARLLTKSDLDTFYGSTLSVGTTYSNTVIKTGGYYCLGTASGTKVYTVLYNGNISTGMPSTTDTSVGTGVHGLRVVVKLKSTARTTGKNSSSVWQLTTSSGV